MKEIGKVDRIRRYPVKSMMGEDLALANVSESGIVGDRVYAFVLENAPNKRFPWMTAREASEMLLFQPRFLDNLSNISVKAPDGRDLMINDEELESYFEQKYKRSLLLRYDARGCKDSKPVSLISVQTVNALGRETATQLEPTRFRANIYADWISEGPFYEDRLIGCTLKIGEGTEIKIVKKDSRCAIPTLDPSSAKPSPMILEDIKEKHAGCAGVYASVKTQGRISRGDPIALID